MLKVLFFEKVQLLVREEGQMNPCLSMSWKRKDIKSIIFPTKVAGRQAMSGQFLDQCGTSIHVRFGRILNPLAVMF